MNQTQQHDTGRKTYLGQSGALKGEDIVRIATSQPATATFVSRKLHRAFLADTPTTRPSGAAPRPGPAAGAT